MSATENAKAVLRRLTAASATERILISFAALIMAVLVGAVIILVSGRITTCQTAATTLFGTGFCYDPVEVYLVLFNGALGEPFLVNSPGILKPLNPDWNPLNFGFALTLKETTLLIFTGLSVAVSFRAGLFNIGTQGQLVLGGLATALFSFFVAPLLPSGLVGGLILIPLAVVVGALVGGLYGAIPGALKAYADANEVITTIMLNFIAAQIAFVLVSEFFGNPDSQVVETTPLPDWATLLPVAFPQGGDFSILALAFGLALVVAVWFLLEQTSFGYDLRTSGEQPEAAEYGGVDAKRTTVTSMFLSGALGGMGGAIWVLMVMGKWQAGVPALGFDGITVSILAGNNPFGVVPAALLFGTLKSGSLAVQFGTGVPKQLVGVLRGLIILFVAMPEFFRMLGSTIDLEPDRETVATDGGSLGGDDE
ncbi:sugar ABC transporter permease [Haloferax prahovense DSM 18310]|uniref:Sugar ABC transporter permease n=1 Tax=Haloferax prahovense (strain DSM 18310 / JCM 13924 / TL6) TaxID=1227461 RepID=M0GJW4_HALPT|nr:ABC transporter permease [Haloferax prahovense]ELZ71837.1 sugar ABC transporter permease [Haloferax prahovense DSM 18310]